MKILSRNSWAVFGPLLLALGSATSAPAAESPLGSPAESAAFFTTDYAAAVRAALPPIEAEALGRLVTEAGEAAAAERPLAVTSVAELERFFGLPASSRETPLSTQFLEAGDASYRVDPGQRFYLSRDYGEVPAKSRAEAERLLPEIQAAHAELAARLGIPSNGIQLNYFREILSETDVNPALEGGSAGEIESEGAMTTLVRSVGGILVEGSFLRLVSIDPSRLELVDGRWPAVRLSRQVATNGVRSPRDVTDGIVRKVEADAGRLPVALHMAVVLRSVENGEYVPSLKVGIEPQAIETEDGVRTDAGEIFYVDLLRDSPPVAEPPASIDSEESKS